MRLLAVILREIKAFFHHLAEDLRSLWSDEGPLSSLSLSPQGLKRFPFPEEIPPILEVAQRYFSHPGHYPVNPYALLLAIRASERGRKGFEFGVVMAKDTDLKTQCAYACQTIKNNFARFQSQAKEKDFIAFLGSRYAPIGAENDPNNLNQHWVKNVRFYYTLFHAFPKR